MASWPTEATTANGARERLHLLSILHYVLAGVVALFSAFPLIHVGLGVAMVTGKFPFGGKATPPPEAFGWIFIVMGSAFILMGLSFAVLIALAGRFLGRATRWTYCVVMAALCCSFFPFRTALGIFTFLALARTEVKALFGAAPTTVAPPPLAGGPAAR